MLIHLRANQYNAQHQWQYQQPPNMFVINL